MLLILYLLLLMTSGYMQASSSSSSSASCASACASSSSDGDMCKGCLPQARCAFFNEEKEFEKGQILQDNQVYAEYKVNVDNDWREHKHHYRRHWFYMTLDEVLVHGACPKYEVCRQWEQPEQTIQMNLSGALIQHELFPDNDKEAWRFLAYKYYRDKYYRDSNRSDNRRALDPSPQTKQLLQKITSDCTDNSTIVWLREHLESRKEGRVFHALFAAMRQQRKEQYLAPKIAQAQTEYYEQKKAGGQSLISYATRRTISSFVGQQLAEEYRQQMGMWPRHQIGDFPREEQEVERQEKMILEEQVRKNTPTPPALLPIRLPTNPHKIAFDPTHLSPMWHIKVRNGKVQHVAQRTDSLVSAHIAHALRTAQLQKR